MHLHLLLRAYDIPVDRSSVEKYTKDEGLAERPSRCKPWGPSEAHYGEAPRKNVIANATAVPVTRTGRGGGKAAQ